MTAYGIDLSLGKSNRLGYRTVVRESNGRGAGYWVGLLPSLRKTKSLRQEADPAAGARVVFLTRADCCLCDDALAEVESARRSEPFELEIVDVDRDASLAEKYGHEVPVVLVDGRKAFKYRVTAEQLLRRLGRRRWLRVF
jgi:Glutaredoxin-like domain (DUF836)